jgi:hypothetical protein
MRMFNRFILFTILSILISCATQKPDKQYDVNVDKSTFIDFHPKILFDDAHNNSHKSNGTYSPFVNLLKNDGYHVTSNKTELTYTILRQYEILVIANAKGKSEKYLPAFSANECSDIEKWINEGGALLLIADHYPFGAAVESLSQKFGVHMFNGEVFDSLYFHGNSNFKDELVFSKANGLLLNNPITEGINTVFTFRGQSLSVPEGAEVLLKLSEFSKHLLPDSIWKSGSKTMTRFQDPVSAFNNCQGLALYHGEGRVIILGEAAMLTAQVYKKEKFGMNTAGNDNKKFALNIIHWLTIESKR